MDDNNDDDDDDDDDDTFDDNDNDDDNHNENVLSNLHASSWGCTLCCCISLSYTLSEFLVWKGTSLRFRLLPEALSKPVGSLPRFRL